MIYYCIVAEPIQPSSYFDHVEPALWLGGDKIDKIKKTIENFPVLSTLSDLFTHIFNWNRKL